VRKYSSILFLILLLANGLGFYVFYVLQLHQIKIEMRESLKAFPNEKLDILELSELEYEEAIVEEDEIQVEGKMYDVARVAHGNGTVKVYCLHDVKEDNLMLLGEIISQPMSEKHRIPPVFIAYLALMFITPATIFDLVTASSDIQRIQFYHFATVSPYIKKFIPPPR
jgi:hypothetical protein